MHIVQIRASNSVLDCLTLLEKAPSEVECRVQGSVIPLLMSVISNEDGALLASMFLVVVGNEDSALGDGFVAALEVSPPVHEVRHVVVLVTAVVPTLRAILEATDDLVECVAAVVVEVYVVASGCKAEDSLLRGCRGQLEAAALRDVRTPDLHGVRFPSERGFDRVPFAGKAARPAAVAVMGFF